MYIYIYIYLLVNVIVRLSHPRSGESQGQETFLAPPADKQNKNSQAKFLYESRIIPTLK